MPKLKEIETLQIELNNNINLLINDFEKKTKTKVLMFDLDKKPFETVLLIDLDDIKIYLR